MPEKSQIETSKLHIWMPFLLSLMVVIGMLVGMKMSGSSAGQLIEDLEVGEDPGPGRVEEVIRYIESKYVDEVNSDELVEEALKTVLKKLDPHSVYLSPEVLARTNEEMNGSFVGIGIESFMIDDTLNVFSVMKGSPADEAGLKAGDRIIAIDDSIVANRGIAFDSIRSLIKKEKDDEIRLDVLPLGKNEIEKKVVVSGDVPLHTSNLGYMLDEKTGYIQLKRFASNTYTEFMLQLEEMVEKKDLKNLIIDVRGNPGGYLPQTTDILSQLFPRKGNLLVYTEGQKGRLTEYKSTGKSFFNIDKIAVLVDEGSASGSEILAGALQDWDRGVIVGRRTFGKGLVQEQYNLKNGAALRLTIARYFTPSGRLIQKPYENLDEYNHEQLDRVESGELMDADKMVINDSTQYFTLKDRRVVYGGGGITPDVFVPVDTIEIDRDFKYATSFLQEFVYRKFVKEELNGYQDILRDKLKLQELQNEFYTFLSGKDYVLTNQQKESWGDNIIRHLKATIAYQFEGEEGKVKVLNESDPDVKAALEVVS